MSESATAHNDAKRSRTNDDDTNGGFTAIGGSTTNTANAGTSNKVLTTKSPLQAALESQKLGFESLPVVSLPYLKPTMQKCLREYAILYYAQEKTKGMKSTVDYVSPAARKMNIVLTNDSDVLESEAFTTLRSNLTARLEAFCVEVTRDIILPSNELTVQSKCRKFYIATCQVYRLLAKTYILLCNISNYFEEQAIVDVIAYRRDDLLVNMNLQYFLTILKEVMDHNIPYPTINHPSGWIQMIDRINGRDSNTPNTPSPLATDGTNLVPPATPLPNAESTITVEYEYTNATSSGVSTPSPSIPPLLLLLTMRI